MKLTFLRIKGFQCFGAEPTTVELSPTSFLIGPNGSGKTAALHALARLFAFDPALRRLRPSDFHVSVDGASDHRLWIEATFEFPELADDGGTYATIPSHFAHMALESADGVPRLRVRLTAELDAEGEIDESIAYVTQFGDDGEPIKTSKMARHDRASIQLHYLPARRDPAAHVSFTAGSLLGRLFRSANWLSERETVAGLTRQISEVLSGNPAVGGMSTHLTSRWKELHRGSHFATPAISFDRDEMESLLRHLTISFSPGHGEATVDFTRLSDGQQSLLYISLVLSVQAIGRAALSGDLNAFDLEKLRPAVFTFIAVEEPENSLSPHYLGRVLQELRSFAAHDDGQVAVATHSPAILRRVPPEEIRYLRLGTHRTTVVTTVPMPAGDDEAFKFVREAVLAYPELYFSRLVILGEGDSEEVVLPRVLASHGMLSDHSSVSVVPLGGRHVNHFWRLLHGLGIPFVTLLDLDLGRHQGGWGRIRYAATQLLEVPSIAPGLTVENLASIRTWDDPEPPIATTDGRQWIDFLESVGVFFSAPLDLDFAMLVHLPTAYGLKAEELATPSDDTISAVLGKAHGPTSVYDADEQRGFEPYRDRFKTGSKPVAHLSALASLTDVDLIGNLPPVLDRLSVSVASRLAALAE